MNAAVNAPFRDENCHCAPDIPLTLGGKVWFIPCGECLIICNYGEIPNIGCLFIVF